MLFRSPTLTRVQCPLSDIFVENVYFDWFHRYACTWDTPVIPHCGVFEKHISCRPRGRRMVHVRCDAIWLDKKQLCICQSGGQWTVWYENNYMCANPDKFQSMILDRDGKSLSISVQDNTILSDPSIKVMGVTLDDKLKFNEHVSEMCHEASWQSNALKINSKYLDESFRILVFKSFISSNSNDCPVSWVFCG